MYQIGIIYGTRPEAIKLAPIAARLKTEANYRVTLIATGQHDEMLHGILEIWELGPDINLHVKNHTDVELDLSGYTRVIKNYLKSNIFDLIIVQGDTTSATAACIAGYELGVPIAHVEAGLRSGDLFNPWPEEGNRRIIDSLCALHLAPTQVSYNHLVAEGHESTATITGNSIVDALNFAILVAESDSSVLAKLESELRFPITSSYVLFTQHRKEGFSGGQKSVFSAIKRIAESGQKIVFPVHLNPSVRNAAIAFFREVENVLLISPQSYLPFLLLMKNCKYLVSDSGGLQEEAPSFQKSIIITRKTTERPEVIDSGYGFLTGFDEELIVERALLLDETEKEIKENPFGDGSASEKTFLIIKEFLAKSNRLDLLEK